MNFCLYMFTLLQLYKLCMIMKIFIFFVAGEDFVKGGSVSPPREEGDLI